MIPHDSAGGKPGEGAGGPVPEAEGVKVGTRPPDEPPIFDPPAPPDPEVKPADPRDQQEMIAYWRARGINPKWARRMDNDRLVTRGELDRLEDAAARAIAALREEMRKEVGELKRQLARQKGGR